MDYASLNLTLDNIFTSEMWAPVVCFLRSFCGWIYIINFFLPYAPLADRTHATHMFMIGGFFLGVFEGWKNSR